MGLAGKISGVIFDMDGVVVDNHAFHFDAWMEFSRRHHFKLDAQIYRDHFNGKTNADLFRMLFGDLSSAEMRELAAEKEALYRARYREHMRPHAGLPAFLRSLAARGIKTALGTSAPPENVAFVLDGLGLRGEFPVVVDGTMVERGKPDPQVYLLCSSRLGLAPESCVVFEDALAGLEAGKRAGCQVVGVATSHSEAELLPHAPFVIRDFEQALELLP